MNKLSGRKKYFNVYGVKVIVEAEYNYEFLQQLDVEYGMFEIMEQFQKYDISFVVESKLSCGGEVLITKCGNRMAIQEKKIFFGGININNPLFYIDDFRPYFTSVIYYNLVIPPATIFTDRYRVRIGHFCTTGFILCEILRKVEAVLFSIFRHIVGITTTIVIRLYDHVNVIHAFCFTGRKQGRKIFTPLLNGFFCT